jgi:hypothetical protein
VNSFKFVKSAPDYLCDLKPLLVGSVSQYNFQKVIIMFYLIVEYKLPKSPSSPLLPGTGTTDSNDLSGVFKLFSLN